MCLGVPGLVVEVDGLTTLVDFWGVRRRIRLDLADEPVRVGDYVLNHVGFAIRRIPPEDVQTRLALYEQLLNWRGIAHVPNGNLRLRDEWAEVDARRRFTIDVASLRNHAPSTLVRQCLCGNIMAGIAAPTDCALFGNTCVPESPVGACMVSSEGTCRIRHRYGGVPDLGACRTCIGGQS